MYIDGVVTIIGIPVPTLSWLSFQHLSGTRMLITGRSLPMDTEVWFREPSRMQGRDIQSYPWLSLLPLFFQPEPALEPCWAKVLREADCRDKSNLWKIQHSLTKWGPHIGTFSITHPTPLLHMIIADLHQKKQVMCSLGLIHQHSDKVNKRRY